uniref:BICD family like cargo adaptor 1 n=1 Tax=Cyprinus carpio TaxID=7962 RepID=A0A8C1M8Y3_CYPCA
MFASCLDLRSAISAPPQLDSDRMDRALDPSRQNSPDSAAENQTLTLLHTAPGGLGMALEEELAMLTREREEDLEISASETPVSGQDSDLLSLFRQKEKDLVLAAKLGKALLERNQDLTKQYDKMTKDLNDKLEVRSSKLLNILQYPPSNRLGKTQGSLLERSTDAPKCQAAEVEKQLSTQVHSLRDDFKEKSISTNQHMTRLETLQAEIKMLSERKQELERRVNAMLEENEQLQHTVDELRERTLVLEKQCHQKDLQLRQSQLELQEVRVSHRQLSARLEELTEECSLQGFSPNPHSILCEIEQSMEQEELEQEREQLRLQLWEAYCQVRSICSHLRGNDITDSALSTDSSMDESSETLSAKDVPTGSLHANLLELRRLTQNLLDGNESTVALLSVEVSSSREENERLRAMAEVHEPNEQLQSAIRDRDEAIKCENGTRVHPFSLTSNCFGGSVLSSDEVLMSVSLSQDDMHRVIDQQLMDKHQEEWKDPPYSFNGSRGGAPSRRAHRLSDGDKRLFSFFKKN